MSSELKYRIGWLIIFSIAMGFLEAAVVIYLRELYYPNGFSFPLTAMDERLGIVELPREAATVVMLAGVGVLTNQRLLDDTGFSAWTPFETGISVTAGWMQSQMEAVR